ncbi:hypothetical protein CKAH01_01475 [Colletotrichum kahawae]|uniref:Uncharacterized protein n=1 Tax=Colletotrichum kahawae TaxID=34407 RepID=A0AAD9Y856_COLKA|nr:hypothetical protein CKAH01_01475 [Colletotrichum kahawae]
MDRGYTAKFPVPGCTEQSPWRRRLSVPIAEVSSVPGASSSSNSTIVSTEPGRGSVTITMTRRSGTLFTTQPAAFLWRRRETAEDEMRRGLEEDSKGTQTPLVHGRQDFSARVFWQMRATSSDMDATQDEDHSRDCDCSAVEKQPKPNEAIREKAPLAQQRCGAGCGYLASQQNPAESRGASSWRDPETEKGTDGASASGQQNKLSVVVVFFSPLAWESNPGGSGLDAIERTRHGRLFEIKDVGSQGPPQAEEKDHCRCFTWTGSGTWCDLDNYGTCWVAMPYRLSAGLCSSTGFSRRLSQQQQQQQQQQHQ